MKSLRYTLVILCNSSVWQATLRLMCCPEAPQAVRSIGTLALVDLLMRCGHENSSLVRTRKDWIVINCWHFVEFVWICVNLAHVILVHFSFDLHFLLELVVCPKWVLVGKVAHDYDMGKPLGFSFTRLCRLEMLGNAWNVISFHVISLWFYSCFSLARCTTRGTGVEITLLLVLLDSSGSCCSSVGDWICLYYKLIVLILVRVDAFAFFWMQDVRADDIPGYCSTGQG